MTEIKDLNLLVGTVKDSFVLHQNFNLTFTEGFLC